MIISHNMVATNANRQFGINRSNSQKSIEKLSSGLRINKAGDDAAGLAISEKMRAQIRGLNQASRNSQDGISLVQTAEGALSETQSIVQRMRELATQSANDTNTTSDREALQNEINQLTSEVNRIGNSTEFNTIPLLKSGNSLDPLSQNILNGLKEKGWLELAEKRIANAFDIMGKNNANIKLELHENIDKAIAYVSYTNANTDLTLAIDLSDFNPATGESGNTSSGFYADQILAHEMTHGIMADSLGFDKMANLPTWFKEGTAEFIPGADNRLKSHISTNGSLDTNKRDNLINRAFDLLNGASWDSNSDDYAAGYLITKYLDTKANENSSDFKNIFNTIKTSTLNGQALIEDAIIQNTSFSDLNAFSNDFKSNVASYIDTLELNFSGKDLDTGSILGIDHNGKSSSTYLNSENVFDNSTAVDKDGQPLQNFTMQWGIQENSYISLQIGSNPGQTLDLEMQDMRSKALMISGNGEILSDGTKATYLSGDKNKLNSDSNNEQVEYALDITSHEKASAAISIYDKALSKISSFRSKLGSYQNRLEHTINNLNATSENLQSSESRIRDTDMAKEMMEFQKYNILQQATQAMLSQANQLPQGVLQLLR